jgi:hypothetical protein
MKKKLSRVIAAVLTLAMAFSVLAVPASAASDGNAYTDAEVADAEAATGLGFMDNAFNAYHVIPRAYLVDNTDSQNPKSMAEATDAEWGQYVLAQRANDQTIMVWTSTIPADAVEGYYSVGTIWLSAADQAAVANAKSADATAAVSLNWQTGEVMVGTTAISTITSRRIVADAEVAADAKALIRESGSDGLDYTIYIIYTKEQLMEEEEATGDAADAAWVQTVLNYCSAYWGWTIYTGDIQPGALGGYLNGDTNQIIWFDQTDNEEMEEIYARYEDEDAAEDEEPEVAFNWDTGVITIDGTEVETLTARLKKAANQNNDTGNNAQTAAGDDSAALLVVGGVVAAAGVAAAVYFSAHPAAWQTVVNNLRSALGLSTPNATAAESAGETAAENAVELPAEADAAA